MQELHLEHSTLENALDIFATMLVTHGSQADLAQGLLQSAFVELDCNGTVPRQWRSGLQNLPAAPPGAQPNTFWENEMADIQELPAPDLKYLGRLAVALPDVSAPVSSSPGAAKNGAEASVGKGARRKRAPSKKGFKSQGKTRVKVDTNVLD